MRKGQVQEPIYNIILDELNCTPDVLVKYAESWSEREDPFKGRRVDNLGEIRYQSARRGLRKVMSLTDVRDFLAEQNPDLPTPEIVASGKALLYEIQLGDVTIDKAGEYSEVTRLIPLEWPYDRRPFFEAALGDVREARRMEDAGQTVPLVDRVLVYENLVSKADSAREWAVVNGWILRSRLRDRF